jgi:hypothetical protein
MATDKPADAVWAQRLGTEFVELVKDVLFEKDAKEFDRMRRVRAQVLLTSHSDSLIPCSR